jgi:predicted dehydrogenase
VARGVRFRRREIDFFVEKTGLSNKGLTESIFHDHQRYTGGYLGLASALFIADGNSDHPVFHYPIAEKHHCIVRRMGANRFKAARAGEKETGDTKKRQSRDRVLEAILRRNLAQMDYTNQRFLFKLKKTLRYVRLYGIRRTLVKVEGQYHVKRKYAKLPEARSKMHKDSHVGIIGCGNFAFSNIAYYLKKNHGNVMHAAMDIDIDRAASLFQRYGLNYYSTDADKIICDPAIDLVFIASNHASHAEYAIRALENGKCVHIEKPHVVNREQLVRLCSAMGKSRGKVALGFNRPNSLIGQAVKRFLDSQAGPAIYNWFIAGHEIDPDNWYFKKEEGGRVLGNLCHWTDFVYRMVPPERRFPLTIRPTRSVKSDSDIAVTYTFGDGSIAAITFSAKGHTFEGVRERFAAHRGNVLISMDDFKDLTVEVVEKKHKTSGLFRDHGHERTILQSYELVRSPRALNPGCSASYVWETGDLFLKTKEALEERKTIVLEPFDPAVLRGDLV